MWWLMQKTFCPHARYDSNSWAPPMSVQTYRHQNLDNEVEEERGPTPPLRGRSSSPAAAPFNQPSSSSLSSAHHEEMQSILQAHLDELTRAYQYEVAKQAWWGSFKAPVNCILRPPCFYNLMSFPVKTKKKEEEKDPCECSIIWKPYTVCMHRNFAQIRMLCTQGEIPVILFISCCW